MELAAPLRCLLSTKTPAPNLGSGRDIPGHWKRTTGDFLPSALASWDCGHWQFSASVTLELGFHGWFLLQTWEMEILLCSSLFKVLWDLWEQSKLPEREII